MDFETFLLDNGYDTSLKGGITFCFLLEEVLCLVDSGKTDKQIKKELYTIYPSYIYRFFRTDGDSFFKEMIIFLKSKKGKKKGSVGRIDDALIRLAKKYKTDSIAEMVDKPKVKNKHR